MAHKISDKAQFHEEDLNDTPPDGGSKAWLSAVAASIFCFTSWGSVGSFSIFLNYYITNDLIPGVSKVEYALIGGVTAFFLLFWSWLVSALTAVLPFKVIMLIGIVLQLVGMLLASWSTKYWEFILTEGVMAGLGSGFIFSGSVFIIPSWFLRKRAIVGGFVFAGTGLGGCVFSLISQAIIDNSGNQEWALRAIAIIAAALNVVALIMVSTRKQLNAGKGSASERFVKALYVPLKPKIWFCKITLLCAGYFCISSIAYMILLYSFSNFAVSVGLTSKEAAYCSAILNAAQFVGRILIGLLSYKYGRFNVTSIFATIVLIFNFALWIPIGNYAGIIAFAVLMGFSMGYQFVTITAIVSDFLGTTNFHAAWCYLSCINSFICLTAELMGIGLVDDGLKKPYLHTQIFTGLLFVVSTSFLLVLREIKVKGALSSWKQDEIDERAKSNSGKFNEENDDTIISHLESKYDKVLSNSIFSYIERMFYPVSI